MLDPFKSQASHLLDIYLYHVPSSPLLIAMFHPSLSIHYMLVHVTNPYKPRKKAVPKITINGWIMGGKTNG